jgi:hypothetical protein
MRLLFTTLSLFVLVGASAAAQFASASSSSPPSASPALRIALGAEGEGEEETSFESDESGACESAAEEVEEWEVSEADEETELEEEAGEECVEEVETSGKAFVTGAPACLVRRAESKIATLPATDQVRLTTRYRTYSPAQVSLGLKLKDRKGSLTIVHTTKHLGAGGVLRLTTKLGAAAMSRALKANEFDVSLHAAGTPASCAHELEQRLHTVKHGAGGARPA